MDLEPEALFRNLNENLNDFNKCLLIINSINSIITEEQLSSTLLDSFLIQIFNHRTGLLHFIEEKINQKQFKPCITKSLEIIYTLINNFPKKLEYYIFDIYSSILTVIKNGNCSTEEKVKAYDVLIIGFEKINTENEKYKDIFKTLYTVFTIIKKSDTLKERELIAFGMFSKSFPQLIEDPKQLKNIFLCQISSEITKDSSQHLINGIYKGLGLVCSHFDLDEKTDKKIVELSFKHIRKLLSNPGHSKFGTRAALLFIAEKLSMFFHVMLNEHQAFHRSLLNWMNLGRDDARASAETIQAFYDSFLSSLDETVHGSVIQFYFEFFLKAINKKEKFEIFTIILTGTRNIIPKLSEYQANQIYSTLSQIVENITEETLEILPNLMQTVSVFIKRKTFFSLEIYLIEKYLIEIHKGFPKLPILRRKNSIDAFLETLNNMNHFKNFNTILETIIYQCLIWTCSHPLSIDAESAPEELKNDIVTVQNFMPFWTLILTQNTNVIKLEQLESLREELGETLLWALTTLTQNLDLKIIQKSESVSIEVQNAYSLSNPNDYAIFLNMIDIFSQLLKILPIKVMKKNCSRLINHFIELSNHNIFISGFYKLASIFLKFYNSFEENTINKEIEAFLKNCINLTIRFKHELLVSVLMVLLETPPALLKDLIIFYDKAFEKGLVLGISHLELAQSIIEKIDSWQTVVDHEVFDQFLFKIIPVLDGYLKNKFLSIENEPLLKRRKTARALQKRKVITNIDPELFKLQKKILNFIGKQNHEICEKFVGSSEIDCLTFQRKILKITLPLSFYKVDFYLDPIIPRLIELSLSCGERTKRVVACELLHAALMVFMGQTKLLTSNELRELDDLLQFISLPLLKLGCDSDENVKQLFQPTFKQLIHWYTNPAQIKSSHSAIVIEALFEGIAQGNDAALQDYCGECLQELVIWSIKHSQENQISPNIKVLIKRIKFYSSHPDQNKRLAAALMFNYTYRELREESEFVNVYWLELLETFLSSLLTAQDSFELFEQINKALECIQRVLFQKINLFEKFNERRRIPTKFQGWELGDILKFVLKLPFSNSSKKCLNAISLFVKKLKPLCCNLETVLVQYTENFDQFKKRFEDFTTNCEILQTWRTCHHFLELLIFSLKYNLYNIANEDLIILKRCIEEVLREVQDCSIREKDDLKQVKCDFLNALLDLIDFDLDVLKDHLSEISLILFEDFLKWSEIYYSIPISKMQVIARYLDLSSLENFLKQFNKAKFTLNPKGEIEMFKKLLYLKEIFGNEPFVKLQNGLIKSFCNNLILLKEGNCICWNTYNHVLNDFTSLYLKFALDSEKEFLIMTDMFTAFPHEIKGGERLGIFILKNFPCVSERIVENFEIFCSKLMESIDVEASVDCISFLVNRWNCNKSNINPITLHIICCNVMTHWYNLGNYFQENEMTIDKGLQFIENFQNLSSRCDLHSVVLIDWIINIISTEKYLTDNFNPIIINCFKLLMIMVKEGDAPLELGNMLNNVFHVSFKYSDSIFNKLLPFIPRIQSCVLFEAIIRYYKRIENNKIELEEPLTNLAQISNTEFQGTLINSCFVLFNAQDQDFMKYCNLIQNILLPIFRTVEVKVIQTFFKANIDLCLSGLRNPSRDLSKLYFYFSLIEILFMRLPLTNDFVLFDPKKDKEIMQDCLKLSFQEIKSNDGEDPAIRLYKCQVYKTSVSIITNSLKDPKFYIKLFYRVENNNDVLWNSLIDKQIVYNFQKEFENIPKIKKTIVSIRNSSRRSTNLSVDYIRSQRLFKSSLSEDITQFDFTNSFIRSEEKESFNNFEEIELELIDVNQQEVMSTVCALIKHIFESGITDLPDKFEDVEYPAWMKGIYNLLMNDSTHKNVKIFWVKVIDNLLDYFNPFAGLFYEPLVKFVSDDVAGSVMNFFISDVLIIISNWSQIVSHEEQLKCSYNMNKVLNFLLRNLNNERNDVFKFNLEILKTFIESTNKALSIPYETIQDFLKLDKKDKGIDVGLHIVSIFSANKIKVWTVPTLFWDLLKVCLMSPNRSTYRLCAETIGILLKNFENIFSEQIIQIYKFLEKVGTKDLDKYGLVLEGISSWYPKILDHFNMRRLLTHIQTCKDHLKLLYLKVFLKNCSNFDPAELNTIDWDKLLHNANMEVQLTVFDIIIACLPSLKAELLSTLITTASAFVTNPNPLLRAKMFEFVIKTEGRFEQTKGILLRGLLDQDNEIRNKLFTFWKGYFRAQSNGALLISSLTNDLYCPEIEEGFLSYICNIILTSLNDSQEMNEVIFEHPLEDCDFEEYTINARRKKSTTFEPLFAETLKSYSEEDFHSFKLRKTISSYSFQPTEASQLNQSDNVMDDSTFLNPNRVQISNRYRRGRFLKDKNKISNMFADIEVKKIVNEQKKRLEKSKEAENTVQIYRTYRKGDFPDIQIELSAILKPLQILVLYDSVISKHLYASILNEIIPQTSEENLVKLFHDNITNIFKNSIQHNPNLFLALFDVLIRCKSVLPKIDVDLLTVGALRSGSIPSAILLLEDYISDCDEEFQAKKGVNVNFSTYVWLKIAELYKELEDFGVVKAVFEMKMNCSSLIHEALKAESEGDWKAAQDNYQKLIETDISAERKDFYYESYFKCFASLGKWNDLASSIEAVACSDTNSPWKSLWDDNWTRQKLLPWYIEAQINTTLFNEEPVSSFVQNLNKSLQDIQQNVYLRNNFSKELALLSCIDDANVAKKYINIFLNHFLEDWANLNPIYSTLRLNKLIELKEIVDMQQFLSIYYDLDFKKLENLKSWKEACYSNLPIYLIERSVLIRKLFLRLIQNKLLHHPDSQIDINKLRNDLYKNMIDLGIQKKNFYFTRKYVQIYKGDDMRLYLSCLSQLKNTPGTSVREQMENLLKASKALNLYIESKSSSFEKLPAYIIRFDWFLKSYDFFNELELFETEKENIQQAFRAPVDNVSDFVEFISSHFSQLLMDCEEELSSKNIDRKKLVSICNGYIKLSHFARKIGRMREFNKCILKAMKLNSIESRQLFPCILSDPELTSCHLEDFLKEVDHIPIWMFLGWIPQLFSYVDSKIEATSPILLKIAEIYPQAVLYPYRLSKTTFNIEKPEIMDFVQKMDRLTESEKFDNFIKALSNVTMPFNILRYYLKRILKLLKKDELEKVTEIVDYLLNNFFNETPNSKNVEALQGNCFKEAHKLKANFASLKKVKKDKLKDKIETLLELLHRDCKDSKLLKDYCPFLANFNIDNFGMEIELPGQYKGLQSPLVKYHKKIYGFSPEVLPLQSLRKPIKLKIIATDGKEYPYLIKFGEDTRQDQRIEQLFSVMNNILERDLKIVTYEVIPLTTSLGLIEWVPQTKVLSELVKNACLDKAMKKYETFYNKNSKTKPIDAYGKIALKNERNKVTGLYQELINLTPRGVLRDSFKLLSVTSENYIALKDNFLKSYGALCAAHWILGIGDRHLGNSLICLKSGKVLGIDFGQAFGTSSQFLPIPELVPIRLTPQIVSVMEPLKEHGAFKNYLQRCLRSLRLNKDSILSTMEVFVKEPSIDWLEHVEMKEEAEWYPSIKLKQVERKLMGASSVDIMIEDLKANPIQYAEAYANLVKGNESDIRFKYYDKDNCTVEDQIDCLLDHATDYNLLGRMYQGWQPWI